MELKTINGKIKTLAKSENVSKTVLAELSRDLLTYVVAEQSHDVDAINRTIAVLTPMNKQTAILFFKTFVPHAFDDATDTFGKLNAKKKEEMLKLVVDNLENPDFNIWVWAADNLKPIEKKPTDFIGNIKKAISAGLTKGELSQHDIIKAALEAGLDLSALVTIMQSAVNADTAPVETVMTMPVVADGSDIQEVC